MHERLAPLQRHVPDAAPVQDRQCARECVRIEIARGAGQRLVPSKAAEVAGGIADIRDRNIADGGQDLPLSTCIPPMRGRRQDPLVVDRIANDADAAVVGATGTPARACVLSISISSPQRIGAGLGYCTALARSRVYSSFEMVPEFFRRSSFSISSAAL